MFGFTGIISTSHYCEKNGKKFLTEEKERNTWIDAISMNLKNQNIDTKVYLGSEIYIRYDMDEILKEKKASSINGGRYVLFELPFVDDVPNLKEIIFKLIENNYIPIIAHPERYKFVQKNPNILIELIDLGVLFQSNYGSVIGQYGKKTQKVVKRLLQNNFIHFLGTDVHRQETIYPKIPEILAELRTFLPQEEIDELTTINAKMVLANEPIDPRRPVKIKTFLFN